MRSEGKGIAGSEKVKLTAASHPSHTPTDYTKSEKNILTVRISKRPNLFSNQRIFYSKYNWLGVEEGSGSRSYQILIKKTGHTVIAHGSLMNTSGLTTSMMSVCYCFVELFKRV